MEQMDFWLSQCEMYVLQYAMKGESIGFLWMGRPEAHPSIYDLPESTSKPREIRFLDLKSNVLLPYLICFPFNNHYNWQLFRSYCTCILHRWSVNDPQSLQMVNSQPPTIKVFWVHVENLRPELGRTCSQSLVPTWDRHTHTIHIHIYIYIYIYMYMARICLWAVYTYMYTYIHVYMYVFMCIYICILYTYTL